MKDRKAIITEIQKLKLKLSLNLNQSIRLISSDFEIKFSFLPRKETCLIKAFTRARGYLSSITHSQVTVHCFFQHVRGKKED